MAKLSLSDLVNITGQETAAITAINNNSTAIETALENTLSRDGTSPNTMGADFDMNLHDILNVNNIDVVTITVDGVPLTNEVYSTGPQGPIGPQGPPGETSPSASTTVEGLLEIGTTAEVYEGTATNKALVSDLFKPILDAIAPVGEIRPFLRNTAPTGWLELNGGTIGNASSGGTARANADTQALFYIIWAATSATDLPIYSSTGTPSSKGASAAADFAANKRLSLPDVRGNFLRAWDNGRGVDTSRTLGSHQDEIVGAHTHTGTTDSQGTHSHSVSISLGAYWGANNGGAKVAWSSGDSYAGGAGSSWGTSSSGAHTHTVTISPNDGAENIPRNTSAMFCIRYGYL